MRRAAVALLVAAAMGGCTGEVNNGRSWDKLDGAVRECARYGGVAAMTAIDNGGRGSTSGFFVACREYHTIRVDD